MIAAALVALLSLTVFASVASMASADPAPQGWPITGDTIRINNDTDLGNAATANGWAGTGASGNPYIVSGSSIDMKDGDVGIYIANITSTYFQVVSWHIYNSTGGIAVELLNISTPFVVSGLTINNTMFGVYVNDSTSSQINHLNIQNVSMSGIEVGNSTAMFVERNHVTNASYAVVLSRCTGSYARFNDLNDSQGSIHVHAFVSGVKLWACSNCYVSYNNISIINVPIFLEWSDHNTLDHNRVFDSAEGIYLDQVSTFNDIQSNLVYNNIESGITINYDCSNNTIAMNTIYNHGWHGIYAVRSSDLNIYQNDVNGTPFGIKIQTSSNRVDIYDNKVQSNTVGIFAGNSTHVTIFHNFVGNSTTRGIFLYNTNGDAVQSNILWHNTQYGVYAYNSTGMRFDYNVLIGNNGATSTYSASHVQAWDNSTTDKWNSTTNEGNYWADRTTPDANKNSIVDVPYAIDGGALIDSFPLAYPVGMVSNLAGHTGLTYANITWNGPNYTAGSSVYHYVLVKKIGTSTVGTFNLASGVTHYNDTAVASGQTYTYEMTAYSDWGQSGTRTVTAAVPATSHPVVNITSPSNGAIFNVTSVKVEWNAWGNGSAIVSYDYRLDAGSWTSAGLAKNHTFAGLSNASHTVTIRVNTADGNNATRSVSFTVDAIAPTVHIDSPANGYLNTTGSLKVKWHGSDAGTGIARYEISTDGSTWINEHYNLSAVLPLADGKYRIYVKAIDNASNSAVATVNVTVETTGPSVTDVVPASGSFVNSSIAVFSWSASDLLTGINRTLVSVDSGAPMNIGFNQTYTIEDLLDGMHWFNLTIYNNASSSTTVSIHFGVDTVAPELNLTAPREGSMYNTTGVNMTWTANGTGSAIAWVKYNLDGGNWTFIPDLGYYVLNVSDGRHTVYLMVFDQANNSAERWANFTVDTVPPLLEISVPVNGSYLNTAAVLVAWNMSDAISGVSDVQIWADSGSPLDIGAVSQYTISLVNDGWHTVYVKAIDAANNSVVKGVTFFVDTHNPTVSILSPADGAYLGTANVTMTYNGTDPFVPSSGVAYYEVSLDAVNWINNGANLSYVFVGLSDGSHTLFVKAVDRAGNFAVDHHAIHVDTGKPEVEITFPEAGAAYASDYINATWTVTDLTPIANYSVSSDGGATWTDIGTQDWYNFTGLAQANNTILVKAVDAAGNANQSSVTFVVDTMAPWVQFVQPSDGQIFAVSSVLVKWNVTDNVTGVQAIWIWIDGVKTANVTVASDYTFASLAEGNHTIGLQAWDNLGNAQFRNVTVLVDTIAPAIVIVKPTADQHVNMVNVTVEFTVSDGPKGSGVAQNWVAVDGGAFSSIGVANTTVLHNLAAGAHSVFVKSQDNAGNVRTVQRNFTIDLVAPTVTDHAPTGTGVSRSITVTVTFSEAMDHATVRITSTFPAYTVSWAGNKVTFTPTAQLAWNTAYTVTVVGKDLAGNSLVNGQYSWSFTTLQNLGTVSGKIVDQNGNAVSGAKVSLDGVTNTTTDANGNFTLSGTQGSHVLTVSKDGYANGNTTVNIVAGQTVQLPSLQIQKNAQDWTWLIIVIIVVIVAIVALVFLRMRGTGKKK